jgi:branched-subunit amino acid aminotransferase/4-amino-4-deoxychorismate lyase
MHSSVSWNGLISPAADPQISALSSAALYGRGVFTTIAVRGGSPLFLAKHFRRLADSSKKIGIDADYSEEGLADSITTLIKKNGVETGRCRVTIFDLGSGGLWNAEAGSGTGVLITTAEAHPASDTFRLTVSGFPVNSRSPLAGVKCCNYLESLLSIAEARAAGFDEAIRLNERGQVVSGSMANVFWIKGDQLFTPDLSVGCLPGTTREFVCEKLEVTEVLADAGDLHHADSIFLTSAGLLVRQVTEIDGKEFAPANNPIVQLLSP